MTATIDHIFKEIGVASVDILIFCVYQYINRRAPYFLNLTSPRVRGAYTPLTRGEVRLKLTYKYNPFRGGFWSICKQRAIVAC